MPQAPLDAGTASPWISAEVPGVRGDVGRPRSGEPRHRQHRTMGRQRRTGSMPVPPEHRACPCASVSSPPSSCAPGRTRGRRFAAMLPELRHVKVRRSLGATTTRRFAGRMTCWLTREAMAGPGDDVVALDRRRMEAMCRQDTSALEALLADDLVYIHLDSNVRRQRFQGLVAERRGGGPGRREPGAR